MRRAAAKLVKPAITAELRRQYEAGSLTLRELADSLDVSIATVWRWLKRQGASRGSRRGRPPNSKKRSLVLDLATQGLTRSQIADQLGITPEWVRVILADNGVAISMHVLKCAKCGVTIATGHKVHQGDQPALCPGCLRQSPHATFGQRLKALRLARNLSVAQLGDQCGLSRTTIENYEKDQAVPTPASFRKLAKRLEGLASLEKG
jgi:transcriptional regulator with XRE-family HTH domain